MMNDSFCRIIAGEIQARPEKADAAFFSTTLMADGLRYENIPEGVRQSVLPSLLRTFNKMFELYPEQRAEGEILLDGDNILTNSQDIALLRAKVGMVFQKPTPFPMSIYDNIAFGVRLFEKLSRADQTRACGAAWRTMDRFCFNACRSRLACIGRVISFP